jgi:hypothetical protein
MSALAIENRMKFGILTILLGATLSARASITYLGNNVWQASSTDSGPIPQGGTTFSSEQSISGIGSPIVSIELILNFSQGDLSLTGDNTGIEGHLILGTSEDSPFIDFYPTATSGSDPNYVYEATFSGSPGTPGLGFNGSNPNDTWGLVLWDNSSSGQENALNGWTLEITVVPEPVTMGLVIFAAMVGLWWVMGLCWKISAGKVMQKEEGDFPQP